MKEENVFILELEGGEVDILNAEKDTVKLTKTGLFLCKEGEVTLTIDGTEYHVQKSSIIIYFSYSNLRIISHSPNLKGTLIGANLETIQPMLYSVTNFNPADALQYQQFQCLVCHQESASPNHFRETIQRIVSIYLIASVRHEIHSGKCRRT